jgi:hypothetical protein
LLATTVQLYDINDVEGFVCATIERSGIQAPEHEREELVADGLRILYELAARFEPQRPGYKQPGRFSGYAAQFLPRRLGDAWHSRNAEHVRIVGEDGRRSWAFRERPISLEQYLAPPGPGEEQHRRADSHTQIRLRSQTSPVPVPT